MRDGTPFKQAVASFCRPRIHAATHIPSHRSVWSHVPSPADVPARVCEAMVDSRHA